MPNKIMIDLDPVIKACQEALGVTVDGKPGGQTWLAIYHRLTGKEWVEPTVDGFPFSAVKLILDEEGIDQPGEWPGGGSGITLGYGCDIGADPASLEFWRGVLPSEYITRLAAAQGITGRSAAHIANRFSDIRVTKEQATDVFMRRSLPVEIAKTKATYPGITSFPASVLGAMTSVTYNRGTDLDRDESDGTRRLELRNIADIIKRTADAPLELRDTRGAMVQIANQIQSMKRLWVGKGLDGLLARRDAEANMITSSLT